MIYKYLFISLWMYAVMNVCGRAAYQKTTGEGVLERTLESVVTFEGVCMILLAATGSFALVRGITSLGGLAPAFVFTLYGFWFYLPALAANQGPGLARMWHLPGGAAPVHVGLFGPNKTWAALYSGITFAIATLFVQRAVVEEYPFLGTLSSINYSEPVLLLGFFFGLGSILGDWAFSFVKRRLGIPPGGIFWPFDQINFVLGSTLALVLAGWAIEPEVLFGFILVMLVIHPAFNWIGFRRSFRTQVM